jgi:heme-degrading monooxygenase HmoA
MVKVVLEHRTRDKEGAQKLIKVIKEVRAEASKRPGFISGETLVDKDDPRHVMVISTWQKAEDWRVWDEDPVRIRMRKRIEELLTEPYTVVTMNAEVIWKEDILHVF